jgi:hypothetical protein
MTMTFDDLTGIAETICKRADAVTVTKLAATEAERGASLFSSFERSAMLTAIAKANDRGGGSDDRVFSKLLQDPGNLLYRQWALLRADATELAKRNSLLDDVAKTRAAGDGAGGAAAIVGRTAFAAHPGAGKTEADKLRDAEIERQMRSGRWQSVEEAARYGFCEHDTVLLRAWPAIVKNGRVAKRSIRAARQRADCYQSISPRRLRTSSSVASKCAMP